MPRYSVPSSGRSTRRRKKGGSKRGVYKKRAEAKKKTQRPGFNKGRDYPKLKHDIMLAASRPHLTAVSQSDAVITLPRNGMRFTVWCPSYRVANSSGRDRDRAQTNCLFVGVKENILFAGDGNVIHRRIVGWSRVPLDAAMPINGPQESLLRNIVLRNPETDFTLDPFLNGTRDVDYLPGTILLSRFDGNVFDVVYDCSFEHAQAGTVLQNVKLWHRCEREPQSQREQTFVPTRSQHRHLFFQCVAVLRRGRCHGSTF
jgi:hypothetical protein